MRKLPDIAVIIVNWKVRELLRECLRTLEADSGWQAGSYDIIVVDNNSQDGSVEMVRESFPSVQLVVNSDNVGFGAANNQALALTGATRIVLLNPDTVVLAGALSGMVEALNSDPKIAIVGCRLLNKDGTLQRWTGGAFPTLGNFASHYLFIDRLLPRSLRAAPLYLDRDLTEPTNVDWVTGACMAIRREALVDDMLFDQRFFMYAEDMELCHRLSRREWIIRYDPRMSIVHVQGASLQQQKAEIMLSSLKCPRDFFQLIHGRRAALVLDMLAVAGFGLRWAINRVLGLLRQSALHKKRAASSFQYFQLALKVMRDAHRRHPT